MASAAGLGQTAGASMQTAGTMQNGLMGFAGTYYNAQSNQQINKRNVGFNTWNSIQNRAQQGRNIVQTFHANTALNAQTNSLTKERMVLGADLDVKNQKRMFNYKMAIGKEHGISPGLLLLGQSQGRGDSTRSTYLNGGYRRTSRYDDATFTGSRSQQQTGTGLI